MKEKLSEDDYALMYEVLNEYITLINENKIKEPFYMSDIRMAKRGRLYKLMFKLHDNFSSLGYSPWI